MNYFNALSNLVEYDDIPNDRLHSEKTQEEM